MERRKTDGSWWVCGQNRDGQLGLGNDAALAQIDAPRRFPYDFEPWAMALASNRGATLVLLHDGTLWTWGIRLGAPKDSTRFKRFKRFANKFLRQLPGKLSFEIREYQTDMVPQKIWELPRDAGTRVP